jgi:HK97 family phage portal protein
MAWATSLRYGLARMLVKSAGYSVIPSWVKTSFIIPSFDRLVSEGYQKNSLVSALISVFTFTLPEPPLMVFDSEGDKGQPLPSHPLRKLLRRPNALMGEDELWQYTAAYAGLGGNAYWVVTLDKLGRPAEGGIWPYHAGQVRPKPGGTSWILGYEFFNGDGDWEDIDPNKYAVVHFKWPLPDPTQPWMAQPPLRSVAGSVDTIAEIDTYIYALLKNNAIPPILVKLPKDREMDKPEKDRFRAQWQAMYGGDKRGGVAILDDGADVSVLGLNLQQLAVDALYRVPETRIAAAFRVPPILAGLLSGLDASTYSNYEQARKSFTQDTLVPLWRAWGAEVESALGELFGAGVFLKHDLSMVASLQEDVTAKWGRVNTAWVSGLLAFDEARKQLGYEKPDANALFMTRKSFSIAFARDIMNPEPPQALDLTPTMPALTGPKEETRVEIEEVGA